MAQQDDNDLDVQVSVVNDAIVVTMPGTSYSVTYRERHEPWLLASDIRDDKNSPISRWTFRAQAWTAANGTRASLGGLYKDNSLGIGTK